jgi:hypothetical protein
MEKAYYSKQVCNFLSKNGIYISNTEGQKNQNQVSESINNHIKYLVSEIFLEKTNSKGFRTFSKTLP